MHLLAFVRGSHLLPPTSPHVQPVGDISDISDISDSVISIVDG